MELPYLLHLHHLLHNLHFLMIITSKLPNIHLIKYGFIYLLHALIQQVDFTQIH